MEKKPFDNEAAVKDFFEAYNVRDFERAFAYLADDCIWDATEKRLHGLEEIHGYWDVARTTGAIIEELGTPFNINIVNHQVICEVLVRFTFKEPGEFMEKPYEQGDICEFMCADIYKLNKAGQVKEALIYFKFFNSIKSDYVAPENDVE